MRIAALLASLLAVGCATAPHPRRATLRWPSNLTTGVAFLSFGVPSMATGAGLFGYAVAHRASPQAAVDAGLFVPGVALFGLAIPFLTVGTILVASDAAARRVRIVMRRSITSGARVAFDPARVIRSTQPRKTPRATRWPARC